MPDSIDPSSEADRTRIITAYDVDAVREEGLLDDVTAFVSRLCEAPVALVTVVGETEQLFVARTGIAMAGTARDISFCTHAIQQDGLMEVRDAIHDPRFAENPLVTGETQVRFYAGVPLMSPDGVALGSVCVLDTSPRPNGLTPLQREGLTMLAGLVMGRLNDRRSATARAMDQALAARALEASELKFRTLADTMPQMVWSTLPDGYHDYYNARWYEFTGAPPGTTDGEGWNGMFHAEDQDRAWATWRRSLETGEPYSIEYRLRHFDGTYRWVLGRALPMRDDGAIVRWFGTCTDIHEQKLAFEEREVISQELSHRIKNIFAVVAGLIGFAARRTPAFAPIATDLRHRITALGRAHDFVRPHSSRSRPTVRQDSLIGLLDELFAPYQPEDGRRLSVKGADIAIDDQSATPLALLFHELATNATKYGALASDGGCVDVTIEQLAGAVRFVWRETGGPRIDEAPAQNGFGSQLIELSAVRQLGGTVTREWLPEGLSMTVQVPLEALRRNGPQQQGGQS